MKASELFEGDLDSMMAGAEAGPSSNLRTIVNVAMAETRDIYVKHVIAQLKEHGASNIKFDDNHTSGMYFKQATFTWDYKGHTFQTYLSYNGTSMNGIDDWTKGMSDEDRLPDVTGGSDIAKIFQKLDVAIRKKTKK